MRAAQGTAQRLNISADFFQWAPASAAAEAAAPMASLAPSVALMSLPLHYVSPTGLFQVHTIITNLLEVDTTDHPQHGHV